MRSDIRRPVRAVLLFFLLVALACFVLAIRFQSDDSPLNEVVQAEEESSVELGGFRLSVESMRWRGKLLELTACFERVDGMSFGGDGPLVLFIGWRLWDAAPLRCHFWDHKGAKAPAVVGVPWARMRPSCDDPSKKRYRWAIEAPDDAFSCAVEWERCGGRLRTYPVQLPARPLRWYLGG
jgi:hypothetical protein